MKEAPKHNTSNPHQQKPFFNKDGQEPFFGGKQAEAADAFFSKTGAQPSLAIGKKDDSFEKQADHTADKVVQRLAQPRVAAAKAPAVQAKADKGKEDDKLQKKEQDELGSTGEKIQRRAVFESDEPQDQKPQVQRKPDVLMRKPTGEGASAAPSSVESSLNNSKGGGAPMEDKTKKNMESAFGADFSGVRIHNDSNAKKMSNDLGAQAFTHGNDIYFNDGKYSPESSSGSHLLAHELTHTIQQGGGVQKKEQADAPGTVPAVQQKMIQKADKPAGPSVAGSEVVDISGGQFNPSENLKEEIETAGHKGLDVQISTTKIGGTQTTTKITGKKNQFDSRNNDYFKVPLNIPYLSAAGPTLHVKINNNIVSGEVGTAKSRAGLDNWIAQNAEALGWFGIKVPSLGGKFTNKFEGGVLNLGINGVSVKIAEFVTATLNAGFQDLQKPTVSLSATVKAKGIAEGTLNINNEKGPLQGSVDIGVNFASFSGNVAATYKPDGNIDIKGSIGYSGNKLSGSVMLIATDKATADNFAKQQLSGANAAEASLPAEVPAAAGKGERALAGMGSLTFNLTDWFAGTVSVIVDGTGAVTVVGKIAPPKEIELFPQKDFDKELFKFEARAAYGIPVVGNVFVFANIALKALAKVGPAKIYNIEVEGTYSTNPDIAKSITIAGSLNISAYAGLRLRAEGGVGLTILGHDIKLGVGVNADAGVKGYVDARPVIGYRDPGEFFFKGHMEIAAQPFLGLSGDLFVELDSPWWSPAPDKKWTWPIGSLEYPLPGEFGIGADMEYVLGSGKTPEISFGKADFDGGKFMTDLVDKQMPAGGGKGTQSKAGKFSDGGAAGAALKPAADAKGGDKGGKKGAPAKGGKGKDKKGKDADKNDELKQMNAAMEKVKALAGGKPLGRAEITAAISKIKSQHKVAITLDDKKSDEWIVTLNAKGKGSKQPAKVKRKKEDDKNASADTPEKQKKLDMALKALLDEDKKIAGDGKMTKDEAEKVAAGIKGKHSDVFQSISVGEAGKNWKYHYIQKKKKAGDATGSIVDSGDTPKVGPHPVSGGKDSESHHVPAKELANTISQFMEQVSGKLKATKSDPLKDLGKDLSARSKGIKNSHKEGTGLAAIAIHKDTHKKKGGVGAHNSANMKEVLEDIQKEAESTKMKKVVILKKTGESRMVAQLNDPHWQAFLSQVYEIEQQVESTAKKNIAGLEKKEDGLVIKITGGSDTASEKAASDLIARIQAAVTAQANPKKQEQEAANMAKLYRGKISNITKSAFSMALSNSVSAVRVALSKSSKDGDKKLHAGALTQLNTEADSTWSQNITGPL